MHNNKGDLNLKEFRTLTPHLILKKIIFITLIYVIQKILGKVDISKENNMKFQNDNQRTYIFFKIMYFSESHMLYLFTL